MVKNHIEVIVSEYIKAIKSRNIRVEKAFLFGSYAKGLEVEDSDIDVAIISPDFGQDYMRKLLCSNKSVKISIWIFPRDRILWKSIKMLSVVSFFMARLFQRASQLLVSI